MSRELINLLGQHRETRTKAQSYMAGCRCECGEPLCTEDGGQSHDYHYREHLADVITVWAADTARADLAAANARIAELEKPRARVHSLSENERLTLLRADNAALRERNASLESLLAYHDQECLPERDRLTARIDKALALADEWEQPGEFRGADNNATRKDCARELVDALAADTPTTATAEGSDHE
jgi:hypothetical protein